MLLCIIFIHVLKNETQFLMFAIPGGGFFVQPSNAWTLKGVVSASLRTGNYKCGVETFSVQINVVKFLGWINDVVAETTI